MSVPFVVSRWLSCFSFRSQAKSWETWPYSTEGMSCRVQPIRAAHGQGEYLGGTWHGQMDVQSFMEQYTVVGLQMCPPQPSRGGIWGHPPQCMSWQLNMSQHPVMDMVEGCGNTDVPGGHWWPYLVCSACNSELGRAGTSRSAGVPCRLGLDTGLSTGPSLVGGLRTKGGVCHYFGSANSRSTLTDVTYWDTLTLLVLFKSWAIISF